MHTILQRSKSPLILALFLGSIGCASLPTDTTATLSGRVQLAQFDETRSTWTLDEATQAVSNERIFTDESVLLSDDLGLANCVLSVHPLANTTASKPIQGALFEKIGPRYIPRVLVVTPGTEVVLRNRNSPCNGFMARGITAQFNRTVVAGEEFRHVFERRGAVPIQCDIREYMRGAIVVVDTDWFAITDSEGRWAIHDLPPGDYEVRLWHERIKSRRGKMIATLAVEAGGQTRLDYSFELAK